MTKPWRPEKEWDVREIYLKSIGTSLTITGWDAKMIELGADAMHKADVDWLKRCLVERPTTGKVRIVLDWQEWQEFIGN